MKTVADTLGVYRSNLVERLKGRSKPRGPYHKVEDAELLPAIRRTGIRSTVTILCRIVQGEVPRL